MLPIRWMKNIFSVVVFISVVVISIKAAFGQSAKSVEDFYRGNRSVCHRLLRRWSVRCGDKNFRAPCRQVYSRKTESLG